MEEVAYRLGLLFRPARPRHAAYSLGVVESGEHDLEVGPVESLASRYLEDPREVVLQDIHGARGQRNLGGHNRELFGSQCAQRPAAARRRNPNHASVPVCVRDWFGAAASPAAFAPFEPRWARVSSERVVEALDRGLQVRAVLRHTTSVLERRGSDDRLLQLKCGAISNDLLR